MASLEVLAMPEIVTLQVYDPAPESSDTPMVISSPDAEFLQ